MVEALQRRGHTVAMTGDGVNDVLALKKADMGIAMGTGTAAAQAVSQIVLVDSRFSTLPGVLAEGRRVTANIERVANLFLNKSVWAGLLAVAVALVATSYPILPRHLTAIDALTIGIPAFFLALAPNFRRFVPGFAYRVARFVLPTGFLSAVAMLVSFLTLQELGATVPAGPDHGDHHLRHHRPAGDLRHRTAAPRLAPGNGARDSGRVRLWVLVVVHRQVLRGGVAHKLGGDRRGRGLVRCRVVLGGTRQADRRPPAFLEGKSARRSQVRDAPVRTHLRP